MREKGETETSFGGSSKLEPLDIVQTSGQHNPRQSIYQLKIFLLSIQTRAPRYNRAHRNFRSLFQDFSFLSRDREQ